MEEKVVFAEEPKQIQQQQEFQPPPIQQEFSAPIAEIPEPTTQTTPGLEDEWQFIDDQINELKRRAQENEEEKPKEERQKESTQEEQIEERPEQESEQEPKEIEEKGVEAKQQVVPPNKVEQPTPAQPSEKAPSQFNLVRQQNNQIQASIVKVQGKTQADQVDNGTKLTQKPQFDKGILNNEEPQAVPSPQPQASSPSQSESDEG